MLAEFLSGVVALADARRKPEVTRLHGHNKLLVTHYNADGSPAVLDIPPARRAYRLESIASLLTALSLQGKQPAVFVAAGDEPGYPMTVTGFFDETDRRERVTLEVDCSVALDALVSLQRPHSQAEAIKTLRDKMFDCIEPGLLSTLRSLDYRRRNDATSVKEHGRDSMGRSIEATVRSKAGDIPEHTIVNLPWFAHRDLQGFRAPVHVAVDVDANTEKVSLHPRGDELEIAHQDAVRYLAGQIQEAAKAYPSLAEAMPILLGTPQQTTEEVNW